MHQMAGGQLPKARYAFVDGMVDFEVLTLQVGAALPAVVEPDEEDPDVVGRAFADQEGIASVMPQASSMRAEVAGQWVSSSMASYNNARVRSYVPWLLMTMLPSQTPA